MYRHRLRQYSAPKLLRIVGSASGHRLSRPAAFLIQSESTNAVLSGVVEHGIHLGEAQGGAIGLAYIQA